MIHFSYTVTGMGLRPVPGEGRSGVEEKRLHRNGKRKGVLRVPVEGVETCTGLGRPQLHRVIPAPAREHLSVGAPSHGKHNIAAISEISVTHATVSYALCPVTCHFTSTVAFATVEVKRLGGKGMRSPSLLRVEFSN